MGDRGGEEGNLGLGATESDRSSHVCFQPNDTVNENTITEKLITCKKSRIMRGFADRVANVWTATGGE